MVQHMVENSEWEKTAHTADNLRETDAHGVTRPPNVILITWNYEGSVLRMDSVAHRLIAICIMKSSWSLSWMDKNSLSFACSTRQEMWADYVDAQGQTINVTHRGGCRYVCLANTRSTEQNKPRGSTTGCMFILALLKSHEQKYQLATDVLT